MGLQGVILICLRDVVGGITTLRLMMILLCDFIFKCLFNEIS